MSELDFKPDYFGSNKWESAEDYQKKFLLPLTHLKEGQTLCWSAGGGFEEASWIQSIIQKVKGWVGFTDYTNAQVVSLRVLRELYEGEMRGWIQKETIDTIISRVSKNTSKQLDIAVNELAQSILGKKAGTKSFKDMHTVVTKYYKIHQDDLYDAFWTRMNDVICKCCCRDNGPQLALKWRHFGDTPLAFAELSHRKGDVDQAFEYFKAAQEVGNNDIDFQKALGKKFMSFIDDFVEPPGTQRVKSILIKLATTAAEHKQSWADAAKYYGKVHQLFPNDEESQSSLAELYLKLNDKDQAVNYLPALISKYEKAKNITGLIALGDIYWDKKLYDKAVPVYEKVLALDGLNDKTLCHLWLRTAHAYYYGHFGASTSLLLLSSVPDYKTACDYYIKVMETLPDDAISWYDIKDNYLKALQSLDDLKKSHYYQNGYRTNEKKWAFFFLKEFYENLLPKKPAEAIILFNSLLSLAETPNNNLNQQQLVDMVNDMWIKLLETDKTAQNAKETLPKIMKLNKGIDSKGAHLNMEIGKAYFDGKIDPQSGGWFGKTVPNYTEAYNHIKKSVDLDKSYQKEAFDKFFALGEKENDPNTKITFYSYAYELDRTRYDQHIPLLLNECEDFDFVVSLYKHSKQQWPNEKMKLDAAVWYKLGNALADITGIVPLKQACEIKPNNQSYLSSYYGLTLKVTKEKRAGSNIKTLVDILEESLEKSKDEALLKQIKVFLKEIYVESAEKLLQGTRMEFSRKNMIQNNYMHEHLITHGPALKQALEFYEKALKVSSEDATVYFEMGEIHELYGVEKQKEYKKYYQLACEKDKTNPFYWRCYATALDDEGQKDEAARITDALRNGPSFFSRGLPPKAPDDFDQVYSDWKENRYQQKKNYKINPHTYYKQN